MLADESGTSISLRVESVDENPNEWLSHLLTVRDESGYEYEFGIYDKNDAYQDWKAGQWYSVREYGLNRNSEPTYLMSKNAMQVDELDRNTNGYTIAVIGDTHLGYEKRNNKVTRNRTIDSVEALDAAVSVIAEDIRPDAVIQTGDMLDDDAGRKEAEEFAKCIERLNEFGTVYYVEGNHGNKSASSTLTNLTQGLEFEHLGRKGTNLNEDIQALGVDEGGSLRKFMDTPSREAKVKIGVFHNNLDEDSDGISVSDIDTKRACDVYVIGHYHDASDFDYYTSDVDNEGSLALYTGSIDGISKKGYSSWDDQNPSVWELRIKSGTVECIRHSLVPKIGLGR